MSATRQSVPVDGNKIIKDHRASRSKRSTIIIKAVSQLTTTPLYQHGGRLVSTLCEAINAKQTRSPVTVETTTP